MARQLVNDPYRFADEYVDGVLRAHPSVLRRVDAERAVMRRDATRAGKVAIVTGGGSGHLPTFMGYVGEGLADGAAIGDVFASPSAEAILSVIRAVNGGVGVVCILGNYSGDRMNFQLAKSLAEKEDISVTLVIGTDDVASAPPERRERRRGIAGIFFLFKILGAAAESGMSLENLTSLAGRVSANTRSLGIALSACTIPAVGHPNFEVPDGVMEVGMGIHGEPGIGRRPLAAADAVADELLRTVLDDLGLKVGASVDLLLNSLGATSPEELYVVYRRLSILAEELGIQIRRAWVGEYATSLDMAGVSLSVLGIDDDFIRYLDAPAHSPFMERR